MNRRAGLAARFLTAQLLVIGVGAVTLALVALAIGQVLFRDHVRQALGVISPVLAGHLNDAFAASAGIAIGVGMGAAVLTAVGVSLIAARRLSRPMQHLADAAATVATGDYAARVPPAGLGPEFDALADAFNAMAAQLRATEITRRRLLADAAHELRTPLATLDAFLEGLADGIRPASQETWDIMTARTLRLRRLADDISLVSRAEEHQLHLDRQPVILGQIAAAAVSAARPDYNAKGVQLTSHLATQLPDSPGAAAARYLAAVRVLCARNRLGQGQELVLSRTVTVPGRVVATALPALGDPTILVRSLDSGHVDILLEGMPRVVNVGPALAGQI